VVIHKEPVGLYHEDRVFARVEAARRDIIPCDIVAEAFHVYRAVLAYLSTTPTGEPSDRKALFDAISDVANRLEGGSFERGPGNLPEIIDSAPRGPDEESPTGT
jgi:hypothetical protein